MSFRQENGECSKKHIVLNLIWHPMVLQNYKLRENDQGVLTGQNYCDKMLE
jgi:hypothetical protein